MPTVKIRNGGNVPYTGSQSLFVRAHNVLVKLGLRDIKAVSESDDEAVISFVVPAGFHYDNAGRDLLRDAGMEVFDG